MICVYSSSVVKFVDANISSHSEIENNCRNNRETCCDWLGGSGSHFAFIIIDVVGGTSR